MVLMKEKLMIFEYQKNLVYNVVSASFFFSRTLTALFIW